MAPKSFKNALPKPAASPSVSQVLAFERGGVGTDTILKSGKTARLSLDVPEELHTRFKAACAKSRRKMTAEVLAFIEKRTAELEA